MREPGRGLTATIIGSLVFYFCLLSAICFHTWSTEKSQVYSLVDDKLDEIARTAVLLLSGDFHDRATDENVITRDEELVNRKAFENFVAITGVDSVRTAVEKNGEFFVTSPTVLGEEGMARDSWYFYPYDDIPKEFKDAYANGNKIYLNHRDKRGFFRSLCMPMTSPLGNRYLVVVDMNDSNVHVMLSALRRKTVLLFISGCIAFLPIAYGMYLLSKKMTFFKNRLHQIGVRFGKLFAGDGKPAVSGAMDIEKVFDDVELLLKISNTSLSGVMVFDAVGRIFDANETALELLRLDRANLNAVDMSSFWGETFVKMCIENELAARKLAEEHETPQLAAQYHIREYEVRTFTEETVSVLARTSSMPVREGRSLPFAVSFYDITELKKQKEKVEYMAFHDSMTGLLNRMGFMRELRQSLIHAMPDSQPSVLVFLVREFKRVNEALGMRVGDDILRGVAGRLQTAVGDGNEVARISGVDFAILCRDTLNLEYGRIMALKLLHIMDEPFFANGQELYLLGNVGVMLPSNKVRTAEGILSCATIAALDAKDSGKSTFRFFADSMQEQSMKRIELEHQMRVAIQTKEFISYFQPIVDMDTKRIKGVEALARWFPPRRKPVSPGEFIPLAEGSGLMHGLSEELFRLSAIGFKRLQEIDPSIYLSLNVSPVLFQDASVELLITSCMKEHGIKPEDVVLEITETALIEDMRSCQEILGRLANMGFSIAIDDFGVGNSSIAYLQNFPIKKLKVDQSFVKNIGSSEEDRVLVKAIIRMAEVMQVDVVAEGVETQLQEKLLCSFSCPLAQGYLYHRPLDVETCRKILESSLFAGKDWA